MRIGKFTLYPEPGPLDDREITWQGADLWRLLGSYFGFTFLAAIVAMIFVGMEDRKLVTAIAEILAVALLFHSQYRHHFWPNADYWQLRWQDFKHYAKQGVVWGIAVHLGTTAIRILMAIIISAAGADLSQLKGNNPLQGLAFGPSWPLLFISVVILAPLTEELFMRGMLYGWLRKHYNVRLAMLISSLVFAFAHLNAFGFVSFFLIGLALASLREHTGSLAPCIIAHGTLNLISVLLTIILTSGS